MKASYGQIRIWDISELHNSHAVALAHKQTASLRSKIEAGQVNGIDRLQSIWTLGVSHSTHHLHWQPDIGMYERINI